MNQAQQSAKWNPRDSMNFREQGAFTEGQKPLRNIQQQSERSLHGAGVKEMEAPSLHATGGRASATGLGCRDERASGYTAPSELGQGVVPRNRGAMQGSRGENLLTASHRSALCPMGGCTHHVQVVGEGVALCVSGCV